VIFVRKWDRRIANIAIWGILASVARIMMLRMINAKVMGHAEWRIQMRKCKDCEYFEILYPPERIGGQLVDWGKLHCKKYDLVTDYHGKQKIERMECWKEDEDGED